MTRVVTLLINCLFFAATVLGQKHSYAGKVFINEKLDQIDFVSDTIMTATFRGSPEKYEFHQDSLILTLPHHHNGVGPRYSFKVIHQSADRFTFIYTAVNNKPDTIQFVNIQNRMEQIREFDSLRIDSYGWVGNGRIIIRGDKTVKFAKSDWLLPNEQPVKYTQFKLPDHQYQEFIDTLSKSLIFMLPKYRGECGEDVTETDFYIHANGLSLTSKGSCLSKIHYKLVRYLFNYIARSN